MRATLERARTVGMVAVEAVKGQRGDRYTRAQMTEGCDECILSEKSAVRNIRLDREINGREYVSPSPIIPSKVVVNVPSESTKRNAGVNESGERRRKRKRKGTFISVLQSTLQRHATTIRRHI